MSEGEGHVAEQPACFVVMPFGRTPEEQDWYAGWYDVVLAPAIRASGFTPTLSAAEEQPGAINDEIRRHLAEDPMVLVDLGGRTAGDPPNPNVMYELGIRHAFDLPLVMMGWLGQNLPFDVSNQRVIMTNRSFSDIEPTKKKIIAFMQAAKAGKYYRPMEAINRIATIEAAADSLTPDSVLSAVVEELKEMRRSLDLVGEKNRSTSFRPVNVELRQVMPQEFQESCFALYDLLGGTKKMWSRLMRRRVPAATAESMKFWSLEVWQGYITQEPKLVELARARQQEGALAQAQQSVLTEEIVEKVRVLLPPQPWPMGTHKNVINTLGITSKMYSLATNELIKRGIFKRQIDGVLYEGNSGDPLVRVQTS